MKNNWMKFKAGETAFYTDYDGAGRFRSLEITIISIGSEGQYLIRFNQSDIDHNIINIDHNISYLKSWPPNCCEVMDCYLFRRKMTEEEIPKVYPYFN